jgi:hypothetical protein
MDPAVSASRPNCDTIIISTDPVAAEFQMIKCMRLNQGQSYTTVSMPNYLKSSGGVASTLSPTYNIGTLNEAQQNVGKIINEVATGWTGNEIFRTAGQYPSGIAVRPNPANTVARFDFWAPEALAGRKAILEIYDMQGRLVYRDKPSILGACNHAAWNGRSRNGANVPAGNYAVYITAGKESLHRVFTLIR